jgi:PhnB protein
MIARGASRAAWEIGMTWKPEGYTSVAPYLVVDGAQRTVDFLVAVFAAEPLRMHPVGERLGHAEVRIDDTVLMLADGMDGWPAIASHVHLYVPDVDATWTRALAAGAEPVQPPAEKGDGDRRGGFRDAGGTTWWISTQVA